MKRVDLIRHLERNAFFRDAIGFLFRQNGPANEIALVEPHGGRRGPVEHIRCEQLEPRAGLGCLAADRGHPLLELYVPRSPKAAVGPEHFTFTVRQGVL